ncbi:HD-GYP domain-containing protein [Bdellovibrio sp. HCB337]|uniref:HD-GYP domain-containing protein n=1 Tax=Bdellovibrio sp. HCB337 TaxID=3394358 RepID=UPI0039A54C0E
MSNSGVFDLVAISTNQSFIQRCAHLASRFSFDFSHYDNPDTFSNDTTDAGSVKCFILDCTKFSNIHEAAGPIQVARQMMDKSYIICILDARVKPEQMELLKKSGANLIILDTEFTSNSKLEFITSQVIKSAYLPIKVTDLILDSSLEAPLYMLMPKNQKYLKVYKPGLNIGNEFLCRYEDADELYLHRNDVSKWLEYVKSFPADEEHQEVRNCRAQFIKLQQVFLDLVLILSDQTSSTSFSDGKLLFEDCKKFTKDLLTSLEKVRYPWQIINNSSVGDFGSVERGTAIAAYAGLLSRKSNIGEPERVMLAALLSDIGILLLSPAATEKIREQKAGKLSAEEKMEFEKHPIFSVNQILSKRIPLDDDVRNMIMLSHERTDQKGFPNQPSPNKITEDSALVRLSQEIDQCLTIRMGDIKKDFAAAFQAFIEAKLEVGDGYSLATLYKLRPHFKVTS